MQATTATHAEDCARLLTILAEGPSGGLTIGEIHEATKSGEVWNTHTISDLLCAVIGRLNREQVRIKGRKSTRYTLKPSA